MNDEERAEQAAADEERATLGSLLSDVPAYLMTENTWVTGINIKNPTSQPLIVLKVQRPTGSYVAFASGQHLVHAVKKLLRMMHTGELKFKKDEWRPE